MTRDERSACVVCAQFLDTGSVWTILAAFSALAALYFAWFASSVWPAVAVAVIWLGERYMAMRVQLDARLFAQLGQADSAEAMGGAAGLDRGLMAVFSVDPGRGLRTVPSRIRGARRLYIWQAALAVGLLVLALVTGFVAQ